SRQSQRPPPAGVLVRPLLQPRGQRRPLALSPQPPFGANDQGNRQRRLGNPLLAIPGGSPSVKLANPILHAGPHLQPRKPAPNGAIDPPTALLPRQFGAGCPSWPLPKKGQVGSFHGGHQHGPVQILVTPLARSLWSEQAGMARSGM